MLRFHGKCPCLMVIATHSMPKVQDPTFEMRLPCYPATSGPGPQGDRRKHRSNCKKKLSISNRQMIINDLWAMFDRLPEGQTHGPSGFLERSSAETVKNHGISAAPKITRKAPRSRTREDIFLSHCYRDSSVSDESPASSGQSRCFRRRRCTRCGRLR